jgi:hypothetical protein
MNVEMFAARARQATLDAAFTKEVNTLDCRNALRSWNRSASAFTRIVAIALAVCGCAGADGASATRSVRTLRFIGEQRIAYKQDFEATKVGGISGIDYNPNSRTWALISDDRSDINPARFYTATLAYDMEKFSSISLLGATFLRQENGTVYPNRQQYATQGDEIPDFEAVRLDPIDDSVWYASEGDRALALDPFVKQATQVGSSMLRLPVPGMFKMFPTQDVGSRNNLTFEGMTFAHDGKSIWVSMEGPLYQDGAIPTPVDGAVSRITQYDRSGKMLTQVAFPVDAIPSAPAAGKLADNGISDMLAVDDHRFLIVERAAVPGPDNVYANYIRIYEMDISGATDTRSIRSLRNGNYVPASKRLVLDLNQLNLPRLDNIEGIAWGPKLANGNDSLVLVSDDNFNPAQVTQFLAFEVLPK